MSQLEWKQKYPEVSRDTIAIVEHEFGVRFPEDYVVCAMKYHGGYNNYDVLHTPTVRTTFNRLLAYEPLSYITNVRDNIQDRLVDDVYPFARDDFGNLFCFDYRAGKDKPPTIAFWDHEEAFLDKEKGVIYICDTFTEFISLLKPYEE